MVQVGLSSRVVQSAASAAEQHASTVTVGIAMAVQPAEAHVDLSIEPMVTVGIAKEVLS